MIRITNFAQSPFPVKAFKKAVSSQLLPQTCMKTQIFATVLIGAVLSGCAVHSPIVEKEQAASIQEQEIAQETVVSATTTPVLKRKLALGRITNETSYGKSLLRNDDGDPLGKQVADIFAKALRQSNQFTVLERTDISSLEKESALTGKAFKAVGADVLIIGSLSEFGRKTEGKSGFFSVAKKQVAYAKMDVRLVDTRNGVVIAAFSGTGEATVAGQNTIPPWELNS